MTTPSVATLVHDSLGERAYKSLRDLIQNQAYPPGSKLSVEQLCRNLGVSRTPVWDPMGRLETKGLVSTVARHGFALSYGVDKARDLVLGLALAAAPNQVLRKLLENVYAQLLVLPFRSLYLRERLASSVAEHRPILAVVAAGDADRAEHVSRAHSDHVLEDALDFTNRAEPSPRFVGVYTAPGTAPRGRGVPIAAAPSGRH